jgi:toxin ParE1/3/4
VSAYRLTPAAQRDLSSIWDYTAQRWDVRQAEKYILEVRTAMERIAADPDRGRACEEIRAGYRRYGIGSHVLFYLERSEGVDIVRILHQRMDPMRHL